MRSLQKSQEVKEWIRVVNSAGFSWKSQTVVVEKSSLPAGLVGPTLKITMEINGQSCEALLCSGSQVTIIF